ncbi:hypothetical protein Pcac1_g24960 [Phytophthora cactorum]|uniref:Reverse transcriptase Ty1/copia-type domain-containing protein n=1 Tax=Phytophthora cactorum TaxID=29920 RepID=A0A8T0YC72_9STRA|nr:hypothetical protein Pcac1_g24960 [Phytophthora cactorum]KAG2797331.1 hypothetical protein PC111_g21339 [Phytophthora cactorum]KAG2801988.1 hypothetical protein PC112_g19815 [Phytophthora cactorum]KAG2837513.1 hypothetical protein PC113_g19816 [Phytophthora cactorum]KAG2891236.1 hypothetical protein PC117_g24298 [Phytophthora cactorum]
MTLYLDTIGIAVTKGKKIKVVAEALVKKVKIKDLGEASHVLGMEIKYVPGKMMLISQCGYVSKLLVRFMMPTPQDKDNFSLP